MPSFTVHLPLLVASFVLHYLGMSRYVLEETFTHSHPRGRRRMIHTYNKVHCIGARPLYGYSKHKLVCKDLVRTYFPHFLTF